MTQEFSAPLDLENNGSSLQDDHGAWMVAFDAAELKTRYSDSWKPKLKVRPDALSYSNRQDYLMRVTASNRLNGIADLCRSLGTDYSTLVSLPGKELNKIFSGVPVERIASPDLPRFWGNGLVKRGLSTRARICPQCILEESTLYHHVNSTMPIPCVLHHLMPVDTCPQCLTQISYLRREINKCDCGFLLHRCEQIPTPTWLTLFFSNFAPWRLSFSSEIDPLSLAILDEQSCRLIGRLLDHGILAAKNSRRNKSWISLRKFLTVKQLMLNWPSGLESAVNAFINKASKSQTNSLLTLVKTSSSSSLRDAVISVYQKYKEEQRQLRNDDISGMPDVFSMSALRRLAKLDAEGIHTLVKKDLEITSCVSQHFGSHKFWVSKADTQSLKNYFANTIDLREASKMLGCSAGYVRALVKCNWLEAEMLVAKPRSPRFISKIIEELLERLRCHSFPIELAKEKIVSLSNIPAYDKKSHVQKAWANLFQAVLDEKALIYSSHLHPDFSQLYVQTSDLLKFGTKKSRLIAFVGEK